MKITTGFLTGNLLLNAGEGVNEAASAMRFSQSLAAAIAAQYPEAEVIVGWNRGSGFLPQELWTAVDYDPGHKEVDAINDIIGGEIRRGDFYVRGVEESPCPANGAVRAGRRPAPCAPAPASRRPGLSPASAPRHALPGKRPVETLIHWMRKRVIRS